MDQNKIDFIVDKTTQLHDKSTELYEALMDKEVKESLKIIDDIRKELLTIRKDLIGE